MRSKWCGARRGGAALETATVIVPLGRDRCVPVGLDLPLREGAVVDPDLIDPPAEEVVIAGPLDPRHDLQGTGYRTERTGLRRT